MDETATVSGKVKNASVDDPLRGFRFRVMFGSQEAGFMKVSGLDVNVANYDWIEVSNPVTATKLIDRMSFGDVTLSRGLCIGSRHDLTVWLFDIAFGLGCISELLFTKPSPRRDVKITAYDKGSQDAAAEWRIYQAWPKSVQYGPLDAMSSNIVLETVVLANEGIRRTV